MTAENLKNKNYHGVINELEGASGAKGAQGAMHLYIEGAKTGAENSYAPSYEPPIGCIDYRSSCLIYENWIRSIRCLPREKQLDVYDMIYDYSLYGILPEPNNSIEFILFNMTIPNIKKSKERYEKSCSGGSLGGREKHEFYDQILDMYLNQQMKPKAISESLEISINTVKSIISRYKQNSTGGCKGAKGANLNVNDNDNVNDDVNVKNAPAPDAGANNSASLTQHAAPAETKETEKTFTYDDEVSVMKLFQQHKRPSEICTLTGFPSYFVNDSIDKFRENNNRLPKPPVDHSKMIMCTDGSVFMNKEEYFNDCTNNGKNNINEIPWDIIKENLIEYKAIDPDEIINEMKDKLLQMQSNPLFLIA